MTGHRSRIRATMRRERYNAMVRGIIEMNSAHIEVDHSNAEPLGGGGCYRYVPMRFDEDDGHVMPDIDTLFDDLENSEEGS
jgi:hypothetical protein